MKNLLVKSCLCLLIIGLAVQGADAQRGGRKRGNNPTTTNPADTTKPGIQNQQNNNNVVPTFDPNANIPLIIDSSGLSDTVVRKSLRNDNAFDKSSLTARMP